MALTGTEPPSRPAATGPAVTSGHVMERERTVATGPSERPAAFVLRALGLGDLLTAVPALRALRRGLPGHEIVLGAPAPLTPIVPMTGGADRLWPLAGLEPVRGFTPRPDLAVNLHGRGPQSHDVLRALRPSRLMAFAHQDRPGITGPPWREEEHEVDRWCRLVAAYGFDADPADLDLDLARLTGPSIRPGAVVVHPGAAHGARRWPPARFAAVAGMLRADGHRVVITGSREESRLARAVARMAGVAARDVLAGLTSLTDLAGLVAQARLVVCGDTGVAHLATACRTPSVVLFGPVPPALWGPPAGRPWHVALWAGHRGSPFGEQPDLGLLEISAGDVLAAAAKAMAAADRAPAAEAPAGRAAAAGMRSGRRAG